MVTAMAAVLVFASSMLVSAAIPDSQTGVISACYSISTVRLIDAQSGEACKKNETLITWNQAGPRGATGPAGTQGPKGDTGSPGPAGAVTIASLQDSPCTRSDGHQGHVDVTINETNAISLNCAFGLAHWCDTNTPTVGPHLNVTCDEATDSLAFYCDVGWVNYDTDIGNGCEVEGFEPSTNALTAFADAFFIGGHNITIPTVCSGSITVACPGGTPMDPPPTIHAVGTDLAIQDIGNDQFNITLNGSIQTAAAIPVSGFGFSCDVTVDTSAGTYPTVGVSGLVTFLVNPSTGVTDRIQTSNASVLNLEDADLTIFNGAGCDLANVLKGPFLSIITADLEGYLDVTVCRAPDPEIFELCPA